jgi:hypothetical protein
MLYKNYYICGKFESLRKKTKIKVYTIFLSWFMIFTHGIIPHTHFEDDNISKSGQIHSTIHHHHESDSSKKFNIRCEDVGVCHISNFLFHQFNQDNLIIEIGRENYLYSLSNTGHIILSREDKFPVNNFFGSATLRAPPFA